MKKLMDKENEILDQTEMANISGGKEGQGCGCSCAYANSGGSSTHDNAWANAAGGQKSKGNTRYKMIVTIEGHEYIP